MVSDHLARLCVEGAGSTGRYTPHAFDLRLTGAERAADHVVYLHEAHHAGLNDVTAWGTALHVFARLPGGEAAFARLLDACRTVHESLATFASVQIAAALHGDLTSVLAAYPLYVPLYRAAERLTGGVPGPNRRQQIATALARLCMQAPILDTILAAGVSGFRIAAVRDDDRPDTRWSWFLRRGPGLLAAAARTADDAVRAEFGTTALESDGPDGDLYAATEQSHDEAWAYWEAVVYESLRTALGATTAATIGLNDHMEATARLLERVGAEYGPIGLRPAMADERRHDDAHVAGALLQQVQHSLADGDRHRAVVMPRRSADEIVGLLASQSFIGGSPAAVVDVRSAARLASLYVWDPGSQPPETAVRLPIEDEGGPAVGHIPLDGLEQVVDLAEKWGDRGPFVLCAAASCLADPGFASRRFGPVSRLVFILVDIELDRFVPHWAAAGHGVTAIPLGVDDPEVHRAALLFSTDAAAGIGVWWLVVANDVTVRLVLEYLRGQLGAALRMDTAAPASLGLPAAAVIGHVLATESFTSFDGLRRVLDAR